MPVKQRTLLLIATLLCFSRSAASPADNCRKVDDGKIVCVCDETKCDLFEFDWPEKEGEAYLVESTLAGSRFAVRELDEDSRTSSTGSPQEAVDFKVEVDLSAERQPILGWGGAMTDATGLNVKSLPDQLGEKLIESYFGPKGNAYNLVRVPIGGSDFSSRPYSYDDVENDFNLTHWKLAQEDLELKIPLLKLARQHVEAGGETLKPFGSPWSPPKWMKTNRNVTRGHLLASDQVYESYANYLTKFYSAYKEAGVEFWGGTVQNEPVAAYDKNYFFNSLQMSANEHIRFVSKFLGPTLAANGFGKGKFNLMVGDDSLKGVNDLVSDILADSKALKFISGVGFHWYASGYDADYSWLDKLAEESLDKVGFVLMTEACAGFRLWQKPLDLGRWARAEEYANDIIEDVSRGASGWVDWNMALDLEAGPNWADNHCDTPIVVDAEKKEFYKQPMFYALGHFSRFFRPNSTVVETRVLPRRRVRTTQWPLSRSTSGLSAVSAHKKDSGHLVVNILNRNKRQNNVTVYLRRSNPRLSFNITIEPNSISTLVVKLQNNLSTS